MMAEAQSRHWTHQTQNTPAARHRGCGSSWRRLTRGERKELSSDSQHGAQQAFKGREPEHIGVDDFPAVISLIQVVAAALLLHVIPARRQRGVKKQDALLPGTGVPLMSQTLKNKWKPRVRFNTNLQLCRLTWRSRSSAPAWGWWWRSRAAAPPAPASWWWTASGSPAFWGRRSSPGGARLSGRKAGWTCTSARCRCAWPWGCPRPLPRRPRPCPPPPPGEKAWRLSPRRWRRSRRRRCTRCWSPGESTNPPDGGDARSGGWGAAEQQTWFSALTLWLWGRKPLSSM